MKFLAIPNLPVVTSLPTAGTVGRMLSYNGEVWYDNGVIWHHPGDIVGEIRMFANASAPSGWKLCDGTAVSRTGNGAKLFAAIGTAYGSGDGSTTFNLPNYTSAFPMGNARATTGGANTVNISHTHAAGSLTNAAEASHTHTFSGQTDSAHDGNRGALGLGTAIADATHYHLYSGTTSAGSSHTHTISGSTAAGGTTTLDNRPAFVGTPFYIFAGY